jgi:hypothetical protein
MTRRPGPRWSAVDDDRLRSLWREKTLEQLAELLGRTPCAIYRRASRFGLPSRSQGFVSLAAAAIETGYDPRSLRRILREAGVAMVRRTSFRTRRNGRAQLLVDRFAARWAVEARGATETVGSAARRRGICIATMHSWLRAAGVLRDHRHKGARHRIPTDVIDAIVAQRRHTS